MSAPLVPGASQPEPRPSSDHRGRARRADLAALLVLATLTALVAWNRLAFDDWLARFDLMTFFLPWYAFLGERLRAFDVPGWNPHLFSGAPFAGDPESGWMYAPAMLFFALVSSATAAFKGMVAAQLAIAAFTAYALARVLGMGALASLVAAVAYLCGPFLHWNTHCCLIFSQFATWIPLSLLGIELAMRARQWRDRAAPWFLSAFAISQMLAGWIGEGWLYAFLLPAAYTLYRSLLSPPRSGVPIGARLISGAATGLAVLTLGSALAAAGMWPRYAVNAETNLAGGDYSRLGEEAAVLNPPWQLDYLLAQTLGSGSGYHFRAAAFGGAVAILVLLALPLARQRFAAPFFAALTLAAMILTLDTTPLHHLFYLIPRFREFHDHDAWRTMALAAIGPAMLSGAAVEALPAWRGRIRLLPFVFVPLLLYLLAAIALTQAGFFLGWPAVIAALLTTALIASVVAAPIARTRPDLLAMLVPTCLLAVIFLAPTGLELSRNWFGWNWDGVVGRHLNRDPAISATLAREVSRSDPGGAGEFLQEQMAADGPFRYVGYGGFSYPGDEARSDSYMARRLEPEIQALVVNGRAIFLGLDDIQGYNPLQLQRYVEFMTALNGQPQDYHTEFLLPSGVRSPLLELLNLRYVVIDASLPQFRQDVRALTEGSREVFRTPEVIVYERDPAPPRAWIVHDVRQVARGEALPLLAGEVIDPFRIALVEGTPPAAALPATLAIESAEVIHNEPDGLTVATSSAAPGLLVVSQIYSSGWRASVDGAEMPILPTFHALQGIPLPAGEHRVELRYDPLSLRAGLIVSGLTTAAMLLCFAVAGWSAFGARRRVSSASRAGTSPIAPGQTNERGPRDQRSHEPRRR